jgi:hypothetical protein
VLLPWSSVRTVATATLSTLGAPVITRRSWFVLVALVALALVPGAALATHHFADVRDDHPHARGIEFVADMGITRGCGDGTDYCPSRAVDRAQMATFLFRSSGYDLEVGPVANALLLNDAFHYEGFEEFELDGGDDHECASAAPLGVELGLAIVTHDLVSSPGESGLSPAAVNVAVDYDGDPAADAYTVCFQTLDGSPLPAGEYETVFRLNVMVEEGSIASASTDHRPVELGPLREAMAAKSNGRR